MTRFLGYTADDIRNLFAEKSFTGIILPNFQWKILNYGRILNNLRRQDPVSRRGLQYQQMVLLAGREVEDALVAFLKCQLRGASLEVGTKEAADSVELVQARSQGGLRHFNRVFTTQSQLVLAAGPIGCARGSIRPEFDLCLPGSRRRLAILAEQPSPGSLWGVSRQATTKNWGTVRKTETRTHGGPAYLHSYEVKSSPGQGGPAATRWRNNSSAQAASAVSSGGTGGMV